MDYPASKEEVASAGVVPTSARRITAARAAVASTIVVLRWFVQVAC